MSEMIRQYEVLKELGSGHFGRVSLCWGETPARGAQPGKSRLVAIKRLKNARDAESLRQLLQEFALLEQVKHRSVVRVFEYLEAERAVVMEYVHGTTLREVLDACTQKREQIFTEAAVEMGCEIADALYQASTTPADNGESLRLVHRDLKPENIMLTPQGEVKILDFGLARVENTDFAREDTSRIRGTPIYMAPEQARGEEIDHRTDLFALGLILYELLMARPAYRVPVDAPDPLVAIYCAIENGELAEPCRELEAKLPGLGSIVTKLLQARPRNRYQTGQELLVDLRRQLYKDRGAYLQEFCSFYFGTVRPLPDSPDPRAPSALSQKGTMSNPPRKSIEERLKESLENAAEPVGKAPVPVRRVSRAPDPEPEFTPRAAPPRPDAPRLTPKIVPRSASAAAKADDEVIVPPSVKGKPAASGKKPMGARSADENGMLPMVPLHENADEREVQGDHSATAFFAIPAPKAERAKSIAAAAAPPMTPSGAGPRPFTPPQQAFQPAQSTMAPAPSQGIQGPVSSYGNQQTPFQAAGPQQNPPANADSRVQSWRVYAILVAVMGLAAFFLVSVVAVGWWKISQTEEKPKEVVAIAAPVAPPPKKRNADTAAPPAAPPVKAPTKTPRTSNAGSTPATPAVPKSDKGSVSVAFTSSPAPLQIEVRCSDGFAGRASLGGGSASISGVPSGADCKMYPKGGVTATAYPVKAGGHYSCSITGTTTSCK